jgi:hypothetical protein
MKRRAAANAIFAAAGCNFNLIRKWIGNHLCLLCAQMFSCRQGKSVQITDELITYLEATKTVTEWAERS